MTTSKDSCGYDQLLLFELLREAIRSVLPLLLEDGAGFEQRMQWSRSRHHSLLP